MISFGLYLVYLSLSYIRVFDVFLTGLIPYRPMLALGLVALAAALLRLFTGHKAALRLDHLALLLTLLAWVGISVAVTGWFGGALEAMNKVSIPVMMFVLTTLNVTSERRFRATVATVVVCTILLAVAAIAAYHVGFMDDALVMRQAMDGPREGEQLLRVRALGSLNDPNDFAQALVIVIPLLATAMQRGARIRGLVFFTALAGMLLYVIYLTHSRGAVLGLLATVAVGARRTIGNIATGTLLALLVVAALASNVAGGRAYSTSDDSAEGRVEAWQDGLSMLKANPLSGIGYGNFAEEQGITAHNSFVLCFAELGLIGYFLWLSLIVAIFGGLGVIADSPPDIVSSFGRRWATALRASLIGFLTCAWFLSRTYSEILYLLLGLSAALMYFENHGELPAPKSWVTRAAVTGLLILIAVYSMVRFKGLSS